MTLFKQAEYKSSLRREKSKEAIALAMENRWEEAVTVNQGIIGVFPRDIEAYNRLGKAHVELGKYDEARAAFTRALQLSPSNSIAEKNLVRLAHLKNAANQPKKARQFAPQYFLEESGKSGTVVLERPAAPYVLAQLSAGDAVTLHIMERRLAALDSNGDYLGLIPPRLANRIIRLINGGNRYQAVVTRLSGGEVTVMLREVYQHPTQIGIASFPTRVQQASSAAAVDIDLQDEDEDILDQSNASEWDYDEDDANHYSKVAFLRQAYAHAEEEEG